MLPEDTMSVDVCEIRQGERWPLITLRLRHDQVIIVSGQPHAARAMRVLPGALEAVTRALAEVEQAKAQLTALIREQAEALLPYPEAPEIQTNPDL